MLVEAYLNKDFESILNKASLVTPDGMPLAFAIRLLYGHRQDLVAGMDLMPSLIELLPKIIFLFFFMAQLRIF